MARNIALLLIIMSGLSGAAPGKPGDVLVVAGDHDFPPYEFLDENGEPAGFHVDLLRAIGKRVGLDFAFDLGPWHDRRRALSESGADVMAMYQAEFREPEVAFAPPHVIVYHEIFVRLDDPGFFSLDELAGRTVVIQRDAFIHEQVLHDEFDARFELAETEAEVLRLLAAGSGDAAIVSSIVGRRKLAELGLDSLTTSGPPLLPVEYSLAVAGGREELLEQLTEGLNKLKASGEFNILYQRWLGSAPPKELTSPLLRWWIPLLFVLSLLVVIAWLWLFRSYRLSGRMEAARLHFDEVTGLPNRLAFEQQLITSFADGDSERQGLVMLHIDIDNFGLVNEGRDHRVGDQVLKQLADQLRMIVNRSGFLARLGGDEFAVLVEGEDGAVELAERIERELEGGRFLVAPDESVSLTVSVGLAAVGEHTRSIGDLLKHSEAACQAAKESGRARVHVYQPDDETLAMRSAQVRTVQRVVDALANDRLRLHCQLIEPADPERSSGLVFEVLVRMLAKDGSVVAAGDFMPAAEKYFIAHRIDRWVITTALEWLDANAGRLPDLECAWINLSTRSLSDDRFLPFVVDQFDQHEISPALVGFEITETGVMVNLDNARRAMNRLGRIGCRFALDDFGVGTSTMAFLKDLPVDVLKIDGSFTRGAVENRRNRQLLREINALGHLLGKTTVAEQVETAEIRAMVAEAGADLVQGYAIDVPGPIDRLVERIRRQTNTG